MPISYVTSKDYNFKLVDFYSTESGYLFKLATTGSRPREYKFVCIPFGRYPSVLMLDFYLGSKKAKDSISKELIQAIKDEFKGVNDLIVLGSQEGVEGQIEYSRIGHFYRDNKSVIEDVVRNGRRLTLAQGWLEESSSQGLCETHNAGVLIDASAEGVREQYTDGGQLSELSWGWRVDNDKDMKIIKDVSLTRTLVKNLNKLDPDKLAFRLDRSDLIIDYLDDGMRPNKRGLEVQHLNQALKDFIGEASIEKQRGFGTKIKERDSFLSVGWNDTTAIRVIDGQRGIIDKGIYTTSRNSLQGLEVLTDYRLADRKEFFSSVVNNALGRFQRIMNDVPTYVPNLRFAVGTRLGDEWDMDFLSEHWVAKLKGRQYPAVKHLLGQANRINERQTLLAETSLYKLITLTPAEVIRGMIKSYRVSDNPALVNSYFQGDRVAVTPTSVLKDKFAHRPYVGGEGHKTVVPINLIESIRDIFASMYIPRDDLTARIIYVVEGVVDSEKLRGKKSIMREMDMLDGAGVGSRIYNELGLIVDTISGGQKVHQKLMDVLTKPIEGFRLNTVELFIRDWLSPENFAGKNTKTMQLTKSVPGVRKDNFSLYVPNGQQGTTLQTKHLTIEDVVFNALRDNAGCLFVDDEVYVALKGPKELNLLTLWKSLRRQDKLLDLMRSYLIKGALKLARIWPSYLMEDEIYAEILGEGASVQDYIVDASREDGSLALMQSDFLAGVQERIEALIECGIITANKDEFGGILIFDVTGDGHNRHSILDLEFDLASKHVGMRGASKDTDYIIANIVERSGHSTELLLSERSEPFAEIAGGFIGGGKWREGCQTYELTAQGVMDEAILLKEYSIGQRKYPLALVGADYGLGANESRGAYFSEGYSLGHITLRGAVSGQGLIAEHRDREALHLIGTSFSGMGTSEYRLAHLTDIESAYRVEIVSGNMENEYSLADRLEAKSALTGLITFERDKEPRLSYSPLPLFSSANAKLAEFNNPEEIMASFEERVAYLATGFVFADTEEQRAQFLEQLNALLPIRTAQLMGDYFLVKHGNKLADVLEENQAIQVKEAFFMKLMEMGQGFIYDYSNDILGEGMNPEDWKGGFGVPEDYDPYDPFNYYYPWSVDLNSVELNQLKNWINFGGGNWERDVNTGRFYSNGEVENVSGFVIEDFTNKDYKFSVDFMVNDTDDDGVGVVFRYVDDRNYYMFMINGGDSDRSLGMNKPMQLYKVTNGVSQAIGSPMAPFRWKQGEKHTVDVEVINERIRILVDNVLQYDYVEP